MTLKILSGAISYPVQAVAPLSMDNLIFQPAYAPNAPLSFSLTIAPNTETFLTGGPSNNQYHILRAILSVDLGGPYLITFGSVMTYRIRSVPPYTITLEFGPNGILCGNESALKLKNEHNSVTGNPELLIYGNLDSIG